MSEPYVLGANMDMIDLSQDGKLVSTTKLPEGEGYQVVVQAQAAPDAKKKNFRIKLLLYTCKECSNPEYACTCADH